MMQWLETLCAVVAAGSISEAAALLRLTQPAVTKQIRALEAELGVQLLVRGPRGVTLTPIGEAIHRHAARAGSEAAACRRLAAEWRNPSQGRLAVGATPALVAYTLSPVVARFRLDRPAVRIEMLTGPSEETVERLLEHKVDVGLVTAPVDEPNIRVSPLFHDALVLATAPRHPFAWGGPVGVADLAGQPLITTGPGSGLRRQVEQVLFSRAVTTPIAMACDSLEAIKAMVALDLGIAILPQSTVAEDATRQRVAAVPLADWPPPAGRTVALVERAGSYAPGPAAAFADLARLLLAQPGP